ncbi:UDP-N-acetylmuramoyl-L-alanine--D-glutamate ligase [Ruminococcus sp. HUN007]|uniref:UDP-N-acetylmuramoyl-L-alanine--D-glutamate ligase n=1 Tax=Ruminococcus sp. HUN007 TaxID=1514668 RepID=UPI0005D20295|nr:UDP-N-acetylmuramoyl-L-alanine--D-glutamate ligase [Ruminococcus sp. HUN007]
MLNLLKQYTEGKNVLILGFGREGKSTYRRLCETGGYASVTIADQNQIKDELPDDVKIISGDQYQESLNDYDIVFKSPGVVLKNDFDSYTCKITSQTEIFLERYASNVIGITGTKGKSTTTTLIHHILSENGVDAVLTGNIGIPCFDVIDNIKDDTKVVFELSCHQLENIRFSPSIAVFLNLFEEHLDHYGSFEKYAEAKQNIYRHQKAGDRLFCNADIKPKKADCPAEIITVSQKNRMADIFVPSNIISYNGETVNIPVGEMKLAGTHNCYNVAVAYAVCRMYGLSIENIMKSVCTYSPLPHRLEYIGTVNEVKYYDDSISTICAAAIQAVKSLKDVDTLIIGGMDRGIDYTELTDFLSSCSVSNIILMSDTGKRINDEIRAKYSDETFLSKLHLTEKLEGAVKLAKELTAKGKSCVMSPAAASYNDFKNFEERGDAFKALVFAE